MPVHQPRNNGTYIKMAYSYVLKSNSYRGNGSAQEEWKSYSNQDINKKESYYTFLNATNMAKGYCNSPHHCILEVKTIALLTMIS